MKRAFLAFFLFSPITLLLAQPQKCYTDYAVNSLRQKNAAYDAALNNWRSVISHIAQQTQPASGRRGALYTIPIVFHVILPSQAQVNSITDLEIQQQVATLNEDFRKQNSDTNIIRSIFQSLASDIEIEFCLAARDPSGNATNGITRTVTSHAAWNPDTEGDDMKDDATGGHDAWNPYKYVNVWIVDIAGSQFGGTAGYAYIGSNGVHGSSVDGIVLDFTLGFGPSNRSLSHEMGHYLGLYHTWGVSGGCSDDDGIGDTPESSTANYDCDFGINSCNTGTGDLPDMVKNYMDYSDCPVMFTAQQKTVMRNILTGVRASLITNNSGCQGVNVPPVANFSASSTNVCPGSSVTFTDASTNGPTSWSWTFAGGTPSASTQQNPTVTYASAGNYTVTLTVTNSYGSDSETKAGYIT
ncbi:MAG TPA: M43 family zinc metalloprotease, partial [Chitinophagales bacterium]|nr:M43 family zinc metalloprotease [Chitinophagales bacterium]